MKKVITLLCLVLMCLALCACDPGSYKISADSFEGVTSVELIEYNNPEQKEFITWVPDQFDDLAPFDTSNATVLETLPEEKIPDFLDAFSKTDILHTYYAFDSPANICIRLKYSDGRFLIIWADYNNNSYAGYIGEYLADGTVLSFWGSFSSISYYQNLVNEFFDYDI